MEQNSFSLELILSLLMNTPSLRTVESLTALISRRQRSHKNDCDLPLCMYKYTCINMTFCWKEVAKLRMIKLQKIFSFASRLLVKSKRERYKIQVSFSTRALSMWRSVAWIFSSRLMWISVKNLTVTLHNRWIIRLSDANTVFTTVLLYRMSHTCRVCYLFILIEKDCYILSVWAAFWLHHRFFFPLQKTSLRI